MKNVLIITYYWPPAGGPGVQRVLKFCKYLREFNWNPYVLTVENGEFPAYDDGLTAEIPDGINVFRSFNPEPTVLYKKLTGKKSNIPTFVLQPDEKGNRKKMAARLIRANFFIPDAKRFWKIFAVHRGLQIIRQNNINLIFTSSPPHTVQLIGRRLARKSSLPWIADFRDPWNDAFWQYAMGRILFKNYDEKLEKNVLQDANKIVTVSADLAKLFNDKIAREYLVIHNGFDEADFTGIKKERNDKFRIIYVGNLGKNQPITSLLKALGQLDEPVLKKISFTFYGSAHSAIHKQIEKRQLQPFITFKPYIPHKAMVQEIVNADLLLLVIPQVEKNSGIVTGKLFEYLATGNFILGIGPEQGDAAKIINATGCGKMYSYQSNLSAVLEQRYNDWLQNKSLKVNTIEIQKYTRKYQTGLLAKIFDGVETR